MSLILYWLSWLWYAVYFRPEVLLPVVIVVHRDPVKLHQDPGGDVSSFVRLEVAGRLDNVAKAGDPGDVIRTC